MAEDDGKLKQGDPGPEPEKGFVSTATGADSNEPVNIAQEREPQTPDQFWNPERELADRAKDPPKNHATKGMTSLGFTEASRLENTAEQQERDRKAAEKAAKREDD